MKEFISKNWDKIINHLKIDFKIPSHSFDLWINPLKFYDFSDNRIILLVDENKIGNSNIEFLHKRYGNIILTAILDQLDDDILSEYSDQRLEVDFITSADKKVSVEQSANNQTSISNLLDMEYTFDNFVVGTNNNMAYACAMAVAEAPAELYNPLFIYGGVGLGKTHLMCSIANYISTNNPNYKVMYVTSEKFTNELVNAIQEGKNAPSDFRLKYRNVDVLLIDDIQFIIGKDRTQEEFFHTFNELHGSKKQIIISSDKPPKDFTTLEDRLRSRFAWGLTVDIQAPDFETRMAILRKKTNIANINIDDEILKYIAINIKSNIRELEGSLTKIIAVARMRKTDITMKLAEETLIDNFSADKDKVITPEFVMAVVAEHFQISADEIKSTNRSQKVAFPRQIAMYLSRHMTSFTLDEIGEALGKKDHSTIIHGINKIEEKYKSDENLRKTLDIISKRINPQ